MWQLVKAEIKYNSDFIYPLVWGVSLFIFIKYYFAVLLDRDLYLTALLLWQACLFFPIALAVKRGKERRDRLWVTLPVSLSRVAAARLICYGFYLAGMLLVSLVLNWCVWKWLPNTIFSLNCHLAITGMGIIYTALFFFLVPDLLKTGRPWLRGIYRLFVGLLVIAAIMLYIPIVVTIQEFAPFRPHGLFRRLFGDLFYRMLTSPAWAALLIGSGLVLCLLAALLFVKRKTYVD